MNPLVAGKGLQKLKNAGIEISVGLLEDEGRNMNKRFFTFHQKLSVHKRKFKLIMPLTSSHY